MCCGGGGGQKERGAPVGGRSARGSRWCAEDRGPRVERENQPRILHRNGERKREGKGWGTRLSRRCTVTETLLQTEPVQRRGIERCPKSIYSLNTDDTGKWLLESNHTPAKKRTTTKTEIK